MNLVRKITTHTSGGVLSKGWYLNDGRYYLVKGNTFGNKEWLSEVLASRMAKYLDVPVVDYSFGSATMFPEIVSNGDCVSICEKMPIQQTYRLHEWFLFRFAGERWVERVDPVKYLKMMVTVGIDKVDLVRLLLFDALIGNSDRHVRNFEVYNNNGRVSLTPAIDFGASLMFDKTERELKFSNGVGYDKAKPFAETHKRQIEVLDRLLGVPSGLFDVKKVMTVADFVNAQDDVWGLEGVSERRRSAIVHYVRNRAMEYLLPFAVR